MTGYRAVLFDVDGTLYRQAPLRLLMAAEMTRRSLAPWRQPSGATVASVVRAYRRAHEALRREAASTAPLAQAQLARTVATTGLEATTVERIVTDWMQDRPLKYLTRCRQLGLTTVLGRLADAGLRLAVLSDYEPAAKLVTLGVDGHFDFALCTTADTVNALKPHPRGFHVACATWGFAPEEVLYVGDRPDVDGEGALAAGLDCVIVGRRRRHRWPSVRRFRDLDAHILRAA